MPNSNVVFKRGNRVDLPLNERNNVLLFTNDTGELYRGNGSTRPLSKVSDVKFVESLPVSDILSDKLYVVVTAGSVELWLHDGEWRELVSGGNVQDSKRIEILLGLKNKKDILTYNEDGEIVKVETTGEVEEVVNYEYLDGNIVKETIKKEGKIIANSFGYDENGNISEIDTVVTDG